MLLSDFHQLVADHLRRGTTLSTQIVAQTKLAVQWLERNYTFKYMESFRLFQAVQGTRTMDLPTNSLIKGWKFLRLVNLDGTYAPLNKIEPEDLIGLRTQNSQTNFVVPEAYFVIGNSKLVFDCVLSQDVSGEVMYYQYSDWPTDLGSTHPLLQFAADVLLQETLLMMALYLRDPRMADTIKVTRDEALNTLTRAEDENKFSGESISMVFTPS